VTSSTDNEPVRIVRPRSPAKFATTQQRPLKEVPSETLGANENRELFGRQTLLLRSHDSSVIAPPGVQLHPTVNLSRGPSQAAPSKDPTAGTVPGSDTEPEDEELAPPPPSMLTGIPSSRSPSPLKPPPELAKSSDADSSPIKPVCKSKSTTGGFGSSPLKLGSSPVRPILSEAGVRALQESFTILGKRRSMNEAAPEKPQRTGKRARPRPKPRAANQTSTASLLQDEYEIPYAYSEETRLLAEEPLRNQRSTRVVYEDPSQRDERIRLMKLLQTEDPDDLLQSNDHLGLRRVLQAGE